MHHFFCSLKVKVNCLLQMASFAGTMKGSTAGGSMMSAQVLKSRNIIIILKTAMTLSQLHLSYLSPVLSMSLILRTGSSIVGDIPQDDGELREI